jgi:hypothetical protein
MVVGRWGALVGVSVGVAAACASSSPPPDPQPADTAQAASDLHGDVALLRRRAERGLAITPVPIDTSSLSDEERTRVGLGSYIVNGTAVCGGCHSSPAGFLAGGNPFGVGPAGQVVYSRNLTPDANTGLTLSRHEFRRVMRTGKDLKHDPTKMLIVMPWLYFRYMSDADLDAIYAYLRRIPAVDNAVLLDDKHDLALPPDVPFPGSYVDGEVPRPLPDDEHRSFDFRRGLAISPEAQTGKLHGFRLREYGVGAYIANSMTTCNECHTDPDRNATLRIDTSAYLTGGTVFAVPPPLQPVSHQLRSMSANLKGAAHGFFNEQGDSYDRFRALIHAGAHVDETPARPLGFPMNLVATNLTNVLEEDLRAVYAYVKRMPSTSGASDVERRRYARWCAVAGDCDALELCAPSTHECFGKACSADADCDACQTCSAGRCQAALATSACVLGAE